MMRTLIMAAALMAASTGAGLAQDVAKGANSSKKCSPCHNIGPGAQNKIGPELNGHCIVSTATTIGDSPRRIPGVDTSIMTIIHLRLTWASRSFGEGHYPVLNSGRRQGQLI